VAKLPPFFCCFIGCLKLPADAVGETAYIEVVGFVLLNRFINKNIAAVCIRYNYSKANSCF